MNNRRDLTKELLAGCFKELLASRAFEKITIKNITDKAGLIRPTFYKHFQDKYEIIEWIFQTDITEKTDLLLENDLFFDAMILMLKEMQKELAFYAKVFRIEGPNSFKAILTDYIYHVFLKAAGKQRDKGRIAHPYLTSERVAHYYMTGVLNIVEDWLFDEKRCTPEELVASYQYLLFNSIRNTLLAE